MKCLMKGSRLSALMLAAVILVQGCGRETGVAGGAGESGCALLIRDSIGVELGESCYMFGAFVMCRDSEGRVLVLDTVNRTAGLYGSSGEHVKTISVEGSGPGEFMAPGNISPLPGDGFIISSGADRKVAFYDGNMDFIREICSTTGSVNGPVRALALTDTSVVCSFSSFRGDSASGVLSLHSSSLNDADAVLALRTVEVQGNPSWADQIWFTFAVSPDSTVFLAERSVWNWRIEKLSREGTLISVIETDYQAVPMTIAEILHDRDIYTRRYIHARGTASGIDYAPPRYRYAIEEMFIDGQDRLWIQSGGRLEPRFEVFSAAGDSLFNCSFDPPVWQLCDEWRFSITPGGFLAAPANPEYFPLLYLLEPGFR